MAQGNLSKQSVDYTLNPQAMQALEKAGIDAQQFATCDGTLIQQDIHASFVNTINALADARPTTLQGRLIKNGAIECAQAGNQLNHAGHVPEAMLYSDLCTLVVEKLLHVADRINPLVAALDVADAVLRAAHANDAAKALETFRTNVEQFRTGFLFGAASGATNINGIYEGLCTTAETIGHFIQYVGEQEALADALEFGRFDDARTILAENHARAVRITTATNYIAQRVSELVEHIPDMTPQEWRDAGFNTGEFVGREAVQFGAVKAGMTGLSKIGQGIATAVCDFETLGRELALSAQLSGNPAAPAIANILAQSHRVENVFVQNGSQLINGITATHPEFASRSIINAGEQFIENINQCVASTSRSAASHTATILELGKHAGNMFTGAKPGFLQLPGGSNEIPTIVSHSETESSEDLQASASAEMFDVATEEVAGKTGPVETRAAAGHKVLADILNECNLRKDAKNKETIQWEKAGNGVHMLQDFEEFGFTSIKTIPIYDSCAKLGIMSDGTKVIARPTSSNGRHGDGCPTLEIQYTSAKKVKIRYIAEKE